MTPESELLRLYARQGDEAAFGEIVHRHINMVYSVAWRIGGGDTPLAQDVTQSVFADLARKAALLCHRATLGGWLHTSARFAACNAVARQRLRHQREQEAATMQQILSTPEVEWEQLRPVLDEAIGHLNARDREAVVLRFFQQKTHREISETLGLTENGARMRVERALEKLRDYFSQRGIKASAALLATAITTYSTQAAPAELAASVTSAAVASSAATGAVGHLLKHLLTMNKLSQIALVAVVAGLIVLPFLRSAAASAGDPAAAPVVENRGGATLVADRSTPAANTTTTNSIVAADTAVPGRGARTLAPAPAYAPAPAEAATTEKTLVITGSYPPPGGRTPAPAPLTPLATQTTTPLSRNMKIRVFGEISPGYPIDVTFIGMGGTQQFPVYSLGANGPTIVYNKKEYTPAAAAGVPMIVSLFVSVGMVSEGYRITYQATMQMPLDNGIGQITYQSVGATGREILQPGETASSATATTAHGAGTFYLTLSEASN